MVIVTIIGMGIRDSAIMVSGFKGKSQRMEVKTKALHEWLKERPIPTDEDDKFMNLIKDAKT